MYYLEMTDGISGVKANYIEKSGVYLDGSMLEDKKNNASTDDEEI